MPSPHASASAASLDTADDSAETASSNAAPETTSTRRARKTTKTRPKGAEPRSAKSTATVRRVPRQERSKILVDCIRIAAKDILQKKGPKALTTNNIAARAGVSIGSLYQYFANKEQILEEVFREQADQSFEDSRQWADWVKDLPVRDVIRVIVERSVRGHREFHSFHPDFYQKHHRELHIGMRNKDSESSEGERYAVTWLREVLGKHSDELRVADPNLAAITLAHGMASGLSGIVETDPTLLYDDALGAKLTAMYCGMLLRDPA